MSKSDLITALAALPDGDTRLATIGAILSGDTERTPSLRLLRVCAAARESGQSRQTLYRCIREGRLPAFRVRDGGSLRVRADDLARLAEGAR